MKIPHCRWIVGLASVSLAAAAALSVMAMQEAKAIARPGAHRRAAPPDPIVQVTPAQGSSFETGLQTLSVQAKAVFIAEGVPLQPDLPAGKVNAWAAGALPLSAAVEKLATTYDYTAARQGISPIFVLRKRYIDPHDLPDVTIQECQQAAQDVERLLAPFVPLSEVEGGNGIDSESRFSFDFVSSLTPEQQQDMKAGSMATGTLTTASLNPRQKALLQRLCLYSYAGTALREIRSALDHLKQASDARLRFEVSKDQNQREYKRFGYEMLGYTRQPTFFPFNALISIQVDYPVQTPPLPEFQPDAPDTAPTLQTVTSSLNTRSKQAKARFEVDAALAQKSVTIVGADQEWAAPEQVFRALAEVYGLRVQEMQGGLQRMLRRRVVSIVTIAEIPTALRHALPLPLLNAANEESAQALSSLSLPELPPDASPEQWKAHFAAMERKNQAHTESHKYRHRAADIRAEAARRLRLTVEPKLSGENAPDSIVVRTLSRRDQSAFAVALGGVLLEWVVRLRDPLPTYLTKLDQSVVIGGPYQDEQGKTKYTLSLKYFIPEKKEWFSPFGVSNMSYPKQGN